MIILSKRKKQKCCYSKGVVPSTLWLPTSSRAAKRLQVHGRAIVVFMRGPDLFVLSTRFPMPTRQHVGMLTHALRRLMHDFVVDAFDDVAIEGSLAIVQPSIITAQHLCRKLPSRAHSSSPSTRSVDVRHEERRRDKPELPLCLRRFTGGSVNKARSQHIYRPM